MATNIELRKADGVDYDEPVYFRANWLNIEGKPSTFTATAHPTRVDELTNLDLSTVGRVVFDGDAGESWFFGERVTNTVRFSNSFLFSHGCANGDTTTAVSNIFPQNYLYTPYDLPSFMIGGTNISVRLNVSLLSGWDDDWTNAQKVVAFKTWLASNNLIVYYKLSGVVPSFTFADLKTWLNYKDGTAALSYVFDSGDGQLARKTLPKVKAEVVTSAAVVAGLGFTPAAASHPHDASDINAGTLSDNIIPTLAQSKVLHLEDSLNIGLDTPIASLNGHTLREVFEDGNMVHNPFIDSNHDNILDAFSKGANVTVYSFLNGEQTFTIPNVSGTFNNGFYIAPIPINTNYYTNLMIKRNNDVGANTIYFCSPIPSKIITLNYENYSHKFNYGANDYRIYSIQSNNGLNISFKNMYLINMDFLGLSSLTVDQMDYWYSVYSRLKNDYSRPASDVYSWAKASSLAAESVPNLDASKITTGTFGLSKLSDIGAKTILGRYDETIGAPQELSAENVQAYLGLESAAYTESDDYRASSWVPTLSDISDMTPLGEYLAQISGLENVNGFIQVDPVGTDTIQVLTASQFRTAIDAAESGHDHDSRYYTETEIGNILGNGITGKILRAGQHFMNVLDYNYSGTSTEIVIKTKIPYTSSDLMPMIHLQGYAFGEGAPIELRVAFYIFGDAFMNQGCTSTCPWHPDIKLFSYLDGTTRYVGLALCASIYYPRFSMEYIDIWGTTTRNYSVGWSAVTNISETTILNSTNISGYANEAAVSYTNISTNIKGNASTATSAGSVSYALTMNDGGAGDTSGSTYNGSAAKTISYNTIGAAAAAHKHTYIEDDSTYDMINFDAGLPQYYDSSAAISYNLYHSGNLVAGDGATNFCAGNDARLSNTRTPNSHASTATTYGAASDTNYGHVKLGATGGAATYEHTHTIGSTAGLMVKTTTSGALTTLAAGNTSQYLRGDGTWQIPASGSTITYVHTLLNFNSISQQTISLNTNCKMVVVTTMIGSVGSDQVVIPTIDNTYVSTFFELPLFGAFASYDHSLRELYVEDYATANTYIRVTEMLW